MCTDDAADFACSAFHQETSEECLLTAQSWDYQGEEEGKEAGNGDSERAGDHENPEDAVSRARLFRFIFVLTVVLIHYLGQELKIS